MPSHTKEIEQIMDDIQMTNTEHIKEKLMGFERSGPTGYFLTFSQCEKFFFINEQEKKELLESQKQQILDAVEKRKEVFNGGFESDEEAAAFDARNDEIEEILTLIKNL